MVGYEIRRDFSLSGAAFVKGQIMPEDAFPAEELDELMASRFIRPVGEYAAIPELELVEQGDVITEEMVNATKGAIALAEELDLDLSGIEGSGDDGRVTKDDVEQYT